ncbi:hypothetical protein PspLS_03100 [Pyricularia sp. CBS 133598]|nr:hypothetical protein PspLS_03100 [Pyricularia sp. CBS 133598]
MKFSTSAVLFSLFASSIALIIDNEGVKNSPRHLFDVVPRATIPQTGAQGANPGKEKKAGNAPEEFKDNNGRTIANGGCCNNGVNLREDICIVRTKPGRCIPESKDREGCVGLTCVDDELLSCDPNVKDRGRDKCVLDRAKEKAEKEKEKNGKGKGKGGEGAGAKAGQGAGAKAGDAAKAADAKPKGQ